MSIHVVHIEDEKPLRNILGVALRTAEPTIQLQQFGSAEDAIPYIEKNCGSIDLFVLDVRLPGTLSGLQIAQKIRDIDCPGHIVFTSAYSPPPKEFLDRMHAEYIPKPWHLVQLTEKLLQYKLDTIHASVGSKPQTAYNSSITGTSNRNKQAVPKLDNLAHRAIPTEIKMTDDIEELVCLSCQQPITTSQTVCSNCGAILSEQAIHHTMPIEHLTAPERRTDRLRGDVELDKQEVLMFEIGDALLTLPQANSMIIGRLQGSHPDAEASVDLTSYGAEQAGLSRRHAKLIRRDNMVYLSDLGSMNGTWLNGRRLFANTEHLLREGDEIRLSSLSVRIAFKSVPQTRPLG